MPVAANVIYAVDAAIRGTARNVRSWAFSAATAPTPSFLLLPSRNLFEVPESVDDAAAVFTEPLAAAFGITERVDISPETSVAVIGDGKLGLLCAMALRLKTEDVSIIGRHPSKLSIAENVGIKAFLAEKAFKVGRRFDVVVEASGSESGLVLAVDLVRPLGSIVLKSTFHGAPIWPASRDRRRRDQPYRFALRAI